MNDSNINNLSELLASLKADNISPDSYHIYIDRFLSFKAREKGIPYTGTFELTPLCNLNCKMCYVHLTPEQMQGRKLLSVEQWKNLMTQAKDAGMMRAKLTGGECLTYPGFDELYLHLHSMGVNVDVLTNGVLLDEKRISFFKKHPPRRIQVTLYGSCEDAYEKVTGQREFSKVYSHVKAAAEADLPISLAITPNGFMVEDALKLVDAAQKSGVKYIINAS
ncbi:MAG: radical SAM protein, partial [Lachnospiraceae bacterium]|nr:radical SAM protein [Lachnospiraceae bacterium]